MFVKNSTHEKKKAVNSKVYTQHKLMNVWVKFVTTVDPVDISTTNSGLQHCHSVGRIKPLQNTNSMHVPTKANSLKTLDLNSLYSFGTTAK